MRPVSSSRAAIYVRMSTESQHYSTDHQRAKIHEYAAAQGLEIVREYVDEGKSGLDIKRRTGLLQLIRDVQSLQADFGLIIVYDVSRWGRFQDIDEAAYHEHTCRRAGIRVVYCGEQFKDDGSPFSNLLKSIKRTMAAEYSRELSGRVFHAQCRFTRIGFKQGGHAGFGLRRLSMTKEGIPRRVLKYREAKGAMTDRVVLIKGPEHEIAVVRRVYALYLDQKLSDAAIARLLNTEGIASEFGRPWTHSMVNSVLTNLKYCGTLAFNRKSCKLSAPRETNCRDEWVLNVDAIEPLISIPLFEKAQAERARRQRRYQPDELLSLLKMCYQTHGRVNARIIAADPTMPDPQILARSFGSLVKAYDAAGLPPCKSLEFVDAKRFVEQKRSELRDEALRWAQLAGATARLSKNPCVIVINETLRVRIEVTVRRHPRRGRPNWKVERRYGVDFVITARLDPGTKTLMDYFLVPIADLADGPLYLKDSNLEAFKTLWHPSLASIFGLIDEVPQAQSSSL